MCVERNESFDELLDEVYGEITIAGCTFSASDILAELDPIAYRVALDDFEYEDDCEEYEE